MGEMRTSQILTDKVIIQLPLADPVSVIVSTPGLAFGS